MTYTIFGESHGPAIGVVLEGVPSGVEMDLDFIRAELQRRAPGKSALTTARKEADEPEILSGVICRQNYRHAAVRHYPQYGHPLQRLRQTETPAPSQPCRLCWRGALWRI